MALKSVSLFLALSACASDSIKGPQLDSIQDSGADEVEYDEGCQDQSVNDLDDEYQHWL